MFSTEPTTIVTLGDSLSDSGVVFDLTQTLLVDPLAFPIGPPVLDPGYVGVFANGPAFTQVAAELLGADLTGYAVGGARLLGEETVGERFDGFELLLDPSVDPAVLDFDLNVGGQLERLLDGAAPSPTDDAPDVEEDDTVLATAFYGLNDIADLGSNLAQAPLVIAQLVAASRQTALDLARSDLVDQVAMYALPDTDFFPGASDLPQFVRDTGEAVVNAVNAVLQTTAQEIESESDVEAMVVRLDLLTEEIDLDAAGYGFAAKGPYYAFQGIPDADQLEFDADLTLTGVDIDPEPDVADLPIDTVQFIDEVHFSGALQGIVGAFSAASFTEEVLFLGDGDDFDLTSGREGVAFGGVGQDIVFMLSGDDVGFGGAGDDQITGGFGDDLISGGSGQDLLRGGSDHDLIFGGAGDDDLRGNRGDDTIFDGAGNDRVEGGLGDDVFVWMDPTLSGGGLGADSFSGGLGVDILFLVTEADVDLGGRSAFEQRTGAWDLDEIGVTARGIEEVIFVDGGLDALSPESFAETTTVPELYAEASLWNLI